MPTMTALHLWKLAAACADDPASTPEDILTQLSRRLQGFRPDGTLPGSAARLLTAAEDRPPRAGDVRALRPAAFGVPAARVLCLLVAAVDEKGDRFLAIPFAPHIFASTDGEWETDLSHAGLGVLQLWNGRWLPLAVLGSTEPVITLPGLTMDEAAEAWRHVRRGEPVGPRHTGRFGPPVGHALDGRHAYLAEEAAMMDRLSDAQPAFAGPSAGPSGADLFTAVSGAMGDEPATSRWEAPAAGVTLLARVVPGDVPEVEFSVRDGSAATPSSVLDGGRIFAGNGRSACLAAGTARLPLAAVAGGFTAETPSGSPLRLRRADTAESAGRTH